MNIIGPKAYIHLDRLKQNLWNIRKQVGDRHLLCVVKADGYGHGATVIARAIAREPGVSFAVFVFEEAMELRHAGITNEILITTVNKNMNPLTKKICNVLLHTCHPITK